MKCKVSFRHMKASDPIRDYAEEKIDKISRLIERGGEAQVTLSVEKHLHRAHIELLTEGSLRIRGEGSSEDMYASVDAAVERIARQVKRYRSKIKSHRGSSSIGRELAHQVLAIPELAAPEQESIPQIVRQEKIVAREMGVEDAVMQMDLLDSEFLVFTNAVSHHVNVVYRLPDGHFGLIEAQQS